MTYDVAIVGAGPAGSMLARLIGAEFRTLLIDQRGLAAPSEQIAAKCCGGLVAPDAQQMLSRLGLGLPREVLAGPQLFVVNVMDLDSGLDRYYQRHYINIDRGRFDRWLVSLAPDTVTRRFGWRLTSIERAERSYRVGLSHGAQTEYEDAAVVVGADGATSAVRRLAFGGATQIARYVAVQELSECRQMPPYFTAIFCRAVTNYYSWIIPKDGMLLLGSALEMSPGAASRFAELKSQLVEKGIPLGPPIRRTAAMLLRPGNTRQICSGAGAIALIGEAAGWISPSSAEGLSYAFRSAAMFAQALRKDPAEPIRAYRSMTRSLRWNMLAKHLKVPFMYNSLLRRCIMGLGIGSISLLGHRGEQGRVSRDPPKSGEIL